MSWGRWIIASSGGVDISALSPEQREGFLGFCGLEDILKAEVDSPCDFLATDVIMPGGDAGDLVRRVSLMRIDRMPVVVLMATPALTGVAEDIAKRFGVHAIVEKPVCGESLARAVEGAGIKDRLGRLTVDKSAVARLLWKLGFTPAVCGFEYALTAIDLVSRDIRAIKSMSESLYPQIARMYSTDAGRVESAIRRAMESAWSSGSPKTQYTLFANTIDEGRGKPTLAQMFACIAERLYSGMEIDI